MTGDTPFRLNRFMLESKWASFVGVTREANLVLRCCGPQLLGQEAAVLVVAVGTLHQGLLDAVPEGTVEILLDVSVTAVAKLGLAIHQKKLAFLRVMRRMAGNTTDVVCVVL